MGWEVHRCDRCPKPRHFVSAAALEAHGALEHGDAASEPLPAWLIDPISAKLRRAEDAADLYRHDFTLCPRRVTFRSFRAGPREGPAPVPKRRMRSYDDARYRRLRGHYAVRRTLSWFVRGGVMEHDPTDDTYKLIRCGEFEKPNDDDSRVCLGPLKHRGRHTYRELPAMER